MRAIKVLVVEDSLFFRNLLVQVLNEDPAIVVVAQAGTPGEAGDAIRAYKPGVMVLDLEMSGMNGIRFLEQLLPQHPLPVVAICAVGHKRREAMEAGVVDFVDRPADLYEEQAVTFLRRELVTKVKIASTAKVGSLKRVGTTSASKLPGAADGRIVAIGASTGGTDAIYKVVRQFHRDIPGVVIVQHMPPGFTKMYAERLNNQCEVAVKEAETGDKVLPGRVLIAPGDRQMRVVKAGSFYEVECKGTEKINGHCPSVGVLFESVAKAAGNKAVGVILTGMGEDGAKGLLAMRRAGAQTVGQDEASCVVYGMPRVAYDIGAVQYQLDVSAIAGKVYSLLGLTK